MRIGTPLALLLAAALARAAEPAASLDCLFDRNCGTRPTVEAPASERGGKGLSYAGLAPSDRKPSFIIKIEGPLKQAPRFDLNLPAIPPRLRHMVEGYESLPSKNQEETEARVKEMNEIIARKNATLRSRELISWTHTPKPNFPPYACLSYAASSAMDWWSGQCGKPLGSYKSFVNGATERGWNPRVFELEFVGRAFADGDRSCGMFGRHVPFDKDPVRNISIPYNPLCYAEMLGAKRSFANTDPYTGEVYAFDASQSPMDGEFLQLFHSSILSGSAGGEESKALAEGLDKWGVAYVQLENEGHTERFPGSHTVAIVGYFCMKDGQNLVECRENGDDEDRWEDTGYFIIHDSFGNFPAQKARAGDGGSLYRAARIGTIDQAFFFPHTLDVTAAPAGEGAWRVSIRNRCGSRPVPSRFFTAWGYQGNTSRYSVNKEGAGESYLVTGAPGVVSLEIGARYYYARDGGARLFQITLDPASETKARETRRPPESRDGGF